MKNAPYQASNGGFGRTGRAHKRHVQTGHFPHQAAGAVKLLSACQIRHLLDNGLGLAETDQCLQLVHGCDAGRDGSAILRCSKVSVLRI